MSTRACSSFTEDCVFDTPRGPTPGGQHLVGKQQAGPVRGCDMFELTDDRISRKDAFWKIVDGKWLRHPCDRAGAMQSGRACGPAAGHSRHPDAPRDDRLFPAQWMRGIVRERLGITPDEITSGHCPALSRPRELAERLEAYRAEQQTSAPDDLRA